MVILPAKHLRQDRALLDLGAEILAQLQESHTVSELWERVRAARGSRPTQAPISFDWFILSVTFLYTISALDFAEGLVSIQTRK